MEKSFQWWENKESYKNHLSSLKEDWTDEPKDVVIHRQGRYKRRNTWFCDISLTIQLGMTLGYFPSRLFNRDISRFNYLMQNKNFNHIDTDEKYLRLGGRLLDKAINHLNEEEIYSNRQINKIDHTLEAVTTTQ